MKSKTMKDQFHQTFREDDHEPARTLSWALDLMEAYENRLIQLGDPEHMVRSDVHKKAKAEALVVLNNLRPKPELEVISQFEDDDE